MENEFQGKPSAEEGSRRKKKHGRKRPPPGKRERKPPSDPEPRPNEEDRSENSSQRGPEDPWRYRKDPAARVKPIFEKYYRELQSIVPTSKDWDRLVELFQTPLPTTIWINDTDPLANDVAKFFESIGSDVISPLPWYPIPNMAWKVHVDKPTFRHDPRIQNLRQYMIRHTAIGVVSRQEEVSMAPVFLLNIQPTDMCLDLCASPGSKTGQMLVALARHRATKVLSEENPFPFDFFGPGMVVANELDPRRANMLVHQVKRFQQLFPFVLFTNHDGRHFPPLQKGDSPALATPFDKILCDVVCTGDGTLRKAPHLFGKWNPMDAVGLQKTQVQLGLRAAHLLRIGGKMVYSTCSLNPIENEAVVSQLVARTHGALRLVDPRGILPHLPSDPGLTTWTVMDAQGNIQSGPSAQFHEACFPLPNPPPELNLQYCIRLLPHHCDGGGFFIALLEKIAPFELPQGPSRLPSAPPPVAGDPPPESAMAESKTPQLFPVSSDLASTFRDFYGLPTFPFHLVFSHGRPDDLRGAPTYTSSRLVFVASTVAEVLREMHPRLTVIAAGLRLMCFDRIGATWRFTHESSQLLSYSMRSSPRTVRISKQMLLTMIERKNLKDIPFHEMIDAELRAQVESLQVGGVLLLVCCDELPGGILPCSGMRARTRLQLFADSESLVEIQTRLGLGILTAPIGTDLAEIRPPIA